MEHNMASYPGLDYEEAAFPLSDEEYLYRQRKMVNPNVFVGSKDSPIYDVPSSEQIAESLKAASVGFQVLDSGKKEEFSTGARRDTQDDKLRFDLIPVESLKRLSELYRKGAIKYGENNFQKGIPFTRVIASLLRHIYAYIEGDRVEDHIAAVAWNAFAIMLYEDRIQKGLLPASLNDMSWAPHTE